MPVPLLDLQSQYEPMLAELSAGFERLIRSGRFVLGEHVARFEAALAEYCGVRHAVGVSSGTDALLTAMMALGVGPGDEVITSPFTFATAGCIVRLGGRPVFADIEPATFNLNVGEVERRITNATKIILPVHLYGQMADMTAIMGVADRRGVTVIEDAAQAIGATDRDMRAGAVGRIGCFSFYPTKNLSAVGDGGACTLDDDELADRLRALRDHGQTQRYIYQYVGGNFRLDEVQAMVLGAKLPRLDGWTHRRRTIAQTYNGELASLPIDIPAEVAGKQHVYHQYTIRVHDAQRDALKRFLDDRQIGCQVYYPQPLHLQPCFADLGYKPGDLPQSERAAGEVLSLPIYPELSDSQQAQVVATIRAFFGE